MQFLIIRVLKPTFIMVLVLFDKNIAIFKDNVRYDNPDTKMFSDQIILNLFTKEIIIKAKKDLEKIQILKN